jgi:hypothetical protein
MGAAVGVLTDRDGGIQAPGSMTETQIRAVALHYASLPPADPSPAALARD